MTDSQDSPSAADDARETGSAADTPRRASGLGGWVATGVVAALLLGLIVLGWTQRGRFTAAEVGARAPDFTLVDMNGGEASLSEYRGQVVLLNFWATWCPPCVHEMPSMERLYQDMRARGFVVLGVSVDVDPGAPDAQGRWQGIVREYVDRLGVTFPILLDPEGTVEDAYNVSGLPTTYVIGRDGRIEGRVVGAREWDSAEYRGRIEELLDG
ncbi:MAG TPA: TlpA disulfide reductase family protein [Terriglobales bacterium]|nr:TlpA disulfide reductase family protein [Terriglobales bacterium]